jgi:hypothetical protein
MRGFWGVCSSTSSFELNPWLALGPKGCKRDRSVASPLAKEANAGTLKFSENDMPAPLPALDPELDLSLALRTIRELSLNEGDLGYAYWTKVHDLLRAAPTMQQHIRDLEHRCTYAERMSSIQPAAEVDASTRVEMNSRINEG